MILIINLKDSMKGKLKKRRERGREGLNLSLNLNPKVENNIQDMMCELRKQTLLRGAFQQEAVCTPDGTASGALW